MDLEMGSTTEDSLDAPSWAMPDKATCKAPGFHRPIRGVNKDSPKKECPRFLYFRKNAWKKFGDPKKCDSSADFNMLTRGHEAVNKIENEAHRLLIHSKKMSNYSLPVKKSSNRFAPPVCPHKHQLKKPLKTNTCHFKRDEIKGRTDLKYIKEDVKSQSSSSTVEPCAVPETKNAVEVTLTVERTSSRKHHETPQRPPTPMKSSLSKKSCKSELKSKSPTAKCNSLRSNPLDRGFPMYYDSVLKMSKIACSVLHDNSEDGINRFMGQLKTQILHELMGDGRNSGELEGGETSLKKCLMKKSEELKLMKCNTSLQDTLIKSPSIKDVPKTHGKYSFLSMGSKPLIGGGKVKIFLQRKEPPPVVVEDQDNEMNEPVIVED